MTIMHVSQWNAIISPRSLLLFLVLTTLVAEASPSEKGRIITSQTQVAAFTRPHMFPTLDSSRSYVDFLPLQLSSQRVLMFYVYGNSIYSAASNDSGNTWGASTVIIVARGTPWSLTGIIASSGRMLVAWVDSGGVRTIGSDNGGNTWSDVTTISTSFIQQQAVVLSRTVDGAIWISYRIVLGFRYKTSLDNGATWSAERVGLGSSNVFVSGSGSSLHAIYQTSVNDIEIRTTTNGGQTWGAAVSIASSSAPEERPRAYRLSNGTLYVFYQMEKECRFAGYKQSDIQFTRSTDNGVTWQSSVQFTRFAGFDGFHNIDILNDRAFITYASSRGHESYRRNIWYGVGGVTQDSTPPPHLWNANHTTFLQGLADSTAAYVDDDGGIESVVVQRFVNGTAQGTFAMYDDGLHRDGAAGDYVFGAFLAPTSTGGRTQYRYILTDSARNTTNVLGLTFDMTLIDTAGYLLNVNNISLPISQAGVLGDLNLPGYGQGGRFDGIGFLYSGGFMMSGKSGPVTWVNGVASSSRIGDYVPGRVGSDANSGVYVVDRDDIPFGTSWQNWSGAVALGAAFHDGNNDGVYTPADLNGNGRWDPNEDAPDRLGDRTAWCVFNDGRPSALRRFSDQTPQGIDIQQTAFGFRSPGDLGNIIFLRYRLINRGTVVQRMDSVYFGMWQDADIGYSEDDMVGCDTARSSGITYNDGSDPQYGPNPPAFFGSFLQEAAVYIPGVTFIDGNGNGEYDPGEVALDTATAHNGPILGVRRYPGARNTGISSLVNYISSHPDRGEPNSATQARYCLLGKLLGGNELDPCNDPFGTVVGVPCASVPKKYWYSGDPVVRYGWLYGIPFDVRQMANTGPFQLRQSQPADIVVGYIVGRGTNALNSITVARAVADRAIAEYRNNFSTITSVGDASGLSERFVLYQNYPNPFNPSTNIKYRVPHVSHVTLKVFDLLGREVATLVSGIENPGYKSVEFDASNLASGVYLYRLQAGVYTDTKKLLVLK